MPEEEIGERQIEGLVIACVAVFLALFIINYFDYIKKMQESAFVEWDVKTITAADYTIEFDIDPTFFDKWIDNEADAFLAKEHQESGKVYSARADAFRDWITQEMESRLSLLPDLGFEEEPVEEIKVAVTTFAYRNGELINMLRQRGSMIKSEDWDGMKKLDSKISKLKNVSLENFTTPCSIFMSFENEEGINRALRYDELVSCDPSLEALETWLGEYTIEI